MLFRCVVLSEGVNMNKEYDVALIYAIQQILAGGYIEKRSILLNGIHRQGIFLYDLLELFPRPLSERRITSSMGLRLTKEESISHIEISVALACFICNEPIHTLCDGHQNRTATFEKTTIYWVIQIVLKTSHASHDLYTSFDRPTHLS